MQQLIFCILLSFSFLGAKNFSLEQFKDAQPTIEESYEAIKHLFTPKQQQYMDKQFEVLRESEKQIITFFYLTSSHLNTGNIKSFTAGIKKLQEKFHVDGMIVLRGFPKNSDFQKFAEGIYKKGDPFKLKIHPMIFSEFKLDRVPAYAVSFCNQGDYFRFKGCKNLYVAKGNVSLEAFLEKIAQKDKRFEPWYQELIQPN